MDTRLPIADLKESDLQRGIDAVVSMREGKEPSSRLEYGLRIADEWTRQSDLPMDVMEERRLELAFARIIAREGQEGEGLTLGSLDYARMLVVDSGLQREAEHCLQLDVLDRQDFYSWANIGNIESAPWLATGTSPTRFTKFAEADLAAVASGRFDEVSLFQRESVEVMLMRGASPRDSELDAQLMYSAAAHNGVSPKDLDVYVDPKDIEDLRRNFDRYDAMTFGEMEGDNRPTRGELAARVDRVELAIMADQMRGLQAKALFDGRPGMDRFEIRSEKVDRAHEVVMAAGNGHVRTRMERASRIALEWQQNEGVPLDRKATQCLERAVGRFISHKQPVELTDVDIAKLLIVDAGIQRLASEKLNEASVGGSGVRRDEVSQTRTMLEKIVGSGEVPGFTRLEEERDETTAIAYGRFADIGDRNGLASAILTAMHRAGRYAEEKVEKEFERLAKENPVGRAQDQGWIDRNAERLNRNGRGASVSRAGAERVQSLSRGPQGEFWNMPERALER